MPIQNFAAIAVRVSASLVGAYAFTWGAVTFGITSLVALGIGYEDAYITLKLLGFLIFLGLFLWAYAAKSVLRLWLILAGGGAGMTTLAWLLQNYLLRGA